MRGSRLRRCRQPFIHRFAFVGLDVAERNPSQPVDRDNSAGRCRNRREQESLPAMEQKRLVGVDQKLVEGQAARTCRSRYEGRQPINLFGDLIDSGFHVDLPTTFAGSVQLNVERRLLLPGRGGLASSGQPHALWSTDDVIENHQLSVLRHRVRRFEDYRCFATLSGCERFLAFCFHRERCRRRVLHFDAHGEPGFLAARILDRDTLCLTGCSDDHLVSECQRSWTDRELL